VAPPPSHYDEREGERRECVWRDIIDGVAKLRVAKQSMIRKIFGRRGSVAGLYGGADVQAD
jgi:hypothetical protein